MTEENCSDLLSLKKIFAKVQNFGKEIKFQFKIIIPGQYQNLLIAQTLLTGHQYLLW